MCDVDGLIARTNGAPRLCAIVCKVDSFLSSFDECVHARAHGFLVIRIRIFFLRVQCFLLGDCQRLCGVVRCNKKVLWILLREGQSVMVIVVRFV